MEKEKENLERIFSAYLKKYLKWLKHEEGKPAKISQHTRRENISVTSNVTKNIKLKIVATPDDWTRLAEQFYHSPETLGIGIQYRYILPVLFKLWPLEKPRGKLRNALSIGAFAEEASFLYAFFSFWVKRPTEEWPDYLQKLVKMIKQDDWFDYVFKEERGTNKPYKLTRYCMEKAFEKSIKGSGRRLFDDPTIFLKNYIHKHSRAKKVAMLFIKDKSSKEVANLAYKPPLENIFKRLKIM